MRVHLDGVDWSVAIAFWLFGNGELVNAFYQISYSF